MRTITNLAELLVRGIRANHAPADWPAEIEALAERLLELADARSGDAAVAGCRPGRILARRDAEALRSLAAALDAIAETPAAAATT